MAVMRLTVTVVIKAMLEVMMFVLFGKTVPLDLESW